LIGVVTFLGFILAGHPSGCRLGKDLAQGELLDVIDDVHTDQVGVEAVEGGVLR
jgi:hypothetical protein